MVQLAQVVIATAGPFRVWKPWIVAVMATSMLVNVLVPHVPGAIAAGGYHPGLVTAVLLFIPSSVAYLRFLHVRGLISTRGILVCFAISLGMLLAAVGSL